MVKIKGKVGLLAGILLFSWGCGNPYYFDLQTEVPPRHEDWRIDKVLLVEDVEISETYRDSRIVCRESPFQVKYHNTASWSKSPDELIEDAVVLFWKQRAVFKKVNTYGSGKDPDWTMRMRIDVIEKYLVQKNWYARLALEMEIVNPENNETLLVHSFDRRSALGKNRIRLVPEKISQILYEELLKVEAKLQEIARSKKEDS